ncbi:MAG: alpha/beta hydrolase [Chloroflexi bacterium]|nr:MAG: alpha/beta hydrolase [Chloroflexota bacterium]
MNKLRSADGTQIAFDRSGAGPALVLVVGAFSDRSSTKKLALGLGSNFTIYEYDRRGRGDSDEVGPYSIEREAEDLAAVIEAAGGSAYAFGHSSGGALVLEAAATGVPIRGLTVYEPPYTKGPSQAVASRLAEMAEAGRNSEAVEAFLALMGTPGGVVEQMKAGPYWGHMESFAHTLAYEVTLCNGGSVPAERLAKISAPTLALAGGSSPAWAGEAAKAIAAAVPNGHARVLDGQGHGVADDVLIPVLKEFFV